MSLWSFVISYLLGGLTFFPLFALAVFYMASNPKGSGRGRATEPVVMATCDPDFKVGELEEQKGVDAFKKGWVYVTNKYYYHTSELQSVASPERDTLPTRDKMKRKKKFYAVLKHGNLFLYKSDAPNTDVFQVIVLKNSFVTVWPRDNRAELSDASLFTNRTCISICKNGKAYLDDDGKLQFRAGGTTGPADQYFVYVDNNVDKEDWYFALINASKISSSGTPLDPARSANTAHLKTKDILYLIQTVNSTEGQFATKWLNTLISRLFLSLQQTEMLNDWLLEKVHKKLTKINKPGFLDDFKIEHIDVGNSAPMITNPKLLEFAPEGKTKIRFNLVYRGNLSLIISTKVNINLGSRFKSREVAIELAMTVRELEGPMILLVKPPPSNRVWYAFESEPLLNLDIEPVVSTRQLSSNMIINVLKSKFKEALRESIVLPYMDDMVFYPTQNEIYRGGIWLHERQEPSETPQQLSSSGESSDNVPANIPSGKFDNSAPSASISDKIHSPSPSPDQKSSSFSSKPSDDELNSSSLRKSVEAHHSSDSDSASERESLGDGSLKTKTMHRVGNLKNMIKARTSTDASVRSVESTSSLDSTTSKKYFQTGMKKIGRWYKDQVNNARDAVTDAQLDILQKAEHGPFIPEPPKSLGPEMISNRRSHPRLKSQSDIKDDFIKSSAESSADMFVNRARATSFDAPKSPNLNSTYPFGSQSPMTPVSPTSASRRLSANSQQEQTHSSESIPVDSPPTTIKETISEVPEFKESTKENKGEPPAPTDMATAAAVTVFSTTPSSILVNGQNVSPKAFARLRPLPVVPNEEITPNQDDHEPAKDPAPFDPPELPPRSH
ncbi:AaceriABR107Wp [[Ashbya] aceris (nom. inval.)]|nr:AaceriABR107Wp [[Ashbya] aceris (nom. inval.)]